jgi:hypothetical protein
VPQLTILFGLLLAGVGAEGYTNAFGLFRVETLHSPTALIPAGFGVVLVLCGLLAMRHDLRKHAMHVAAVVGLLGAGAGLGMGLAKLPRLLDGTAERPSAVKLQLAMGAVSAVFLALCVKSFIDARRRRLRASAP